MAAWRERFPQDVIDERQFFAQRRAERRAERAAYRADKRTRKAAADFDIELGEASTWDRNDNRFLDAFLEISDTDDSEEDVFTTDSEDDE